MVTDNITSLRNGIREICVARQRDPKSVKIVLVTKTIDVVQIHEAYTADVRIFGENKVQELVRKVDELPNDAEWHFIGHLQSNKVKDIYDKVTLIHSLDSIKLAKQINKYAQKSQEKSKVLLQVNVSEESSKFGIACSEVESFLRIVQEFEWLDIQGFMTIGPNVDNDEHIRSCFRSLRELRDEMQAKFPSCVLQELSMGMSHDYKIAIEEGATIIRVGSLIFGERDYM